MSKFHLAVTGHRPNKLGRDTYNVTSELSERYIKFFLNYIFNLSWEHPGQTIVGISGMALGVDTLFAIAFIRARNMGYNVELLCAIPCLHQDKMWQADSKKIYHSILDRADSVHFVSNNEYTSACMQDRNIFMVDSSDLLLAIWNGTSGGTGNCVRYAKSVNKPVDVVSPKLFD